jgi:hypothetical protein
MKKGQFWYGDFLVAVLILMIIGMLFVTSIRDITSRNEIIKELIIEASDVSSLLMSKGYNIDGWSDYKGTLGFMSDNIFDFDKFYSFLVLDYGTQKVMLGTRYNAWIYLEDRNGEIKESNNDAILNSLGLIINSVSDISSNNLVHIKRFVFYENDIHVLGVVVWQ